MNVIELQADAKINLHLDVIDVEENGYHRIKTVMQSISLSDTLIIGKTAGKGITMSSDVAAIPTDGRNLCYRAAEKFFTATGIDSGVDIRLIKKIPMSAGLAGGSTDAAATLKGLNLLFEAGLSYKELCDMAATIGADVPFCLRGGTQFGDHYGEVLKPFPQMPFLYLVVACAGEGVSTPWAYGKLDEAYESFSGQSYRPRAISKLENAMERGSLTETADAIFNIFENVIRKERPMVDELIRLMTENGAITAHMSGSGPAVFGLFDSENAASTVADILLNKGIPAFVAEPTYPEGM